MREKQSKKDIKNSRTTNKTSIPAPLNLSRLDHRAQLGETLRESEIHCPILQLPDMLYELVGGVHRARGMIHH